MKITISGNNNRNHDDWPRSSRYLCHHCCHGFGSVPIMVPVWSQGCYHLNGNYCSWNCAKAHVLSKAKHAFPKEVTTIALFAYQISFRGKHCGFKQGKHPATCPCHSRYHGVLPAQDKETLEAFGGHLSITQFRRKSLTIDSYEWITRIYRPRELMKEVSHVDPKYLYTMQPIRKVKLLDCDNEDDDPIVMIKRRVY